VLDQCERVIGIVSSTDISRALQLADLRSFHAYPPPRGADFTTTGPWPRGNHEPRAPEPTVLIGHYLERQMYITVTLVLAVGLAAVTAIGVRPTAPGEPWWRSFGSCCRSHSSSRRCSQSWPRTSVLSQ
jgi:hypothetical protein